MVFSVMKEPKHCVFKTKVLVLQLPKFSESVTSETSELWVIYLLLGMGYQEILWSG